MHQNNTLWAATWPCWRRQTSECSKLRIKFLTLPISPFCRGFRATRMGTQPSSMNNVSLYIVFIMLMPLTAKKRQSSRVYLKRHRAGLESLVPVRCVKSFAKVHHQTKVWCNRHKGRSRSTGHGSWIDVIASQPSIKPRPKFRVSACDYQYEILTLSLVKRRKIFNWCQDSLCQAFCYISPSPSSSYYAIYCSIVITSAIQSYSIWSQAAQRQLQWHLPNSSRR